MAYRFSASKLVSAGLVGALAISGCAPVITAGVPTVTVTRGGLSAEEAELQRRSNALQKTIIEGAATGAAAGAALSLANGGNNFWRNVLVGAAVGGLAGSYVASLQRNFSDRESQLKQARSDIKATNTDVAATLSIMRTVQRREIAEVNQLRAALAAGRTDSASLAARISVAEANLADMEGAIDGAENRAAEFTQARAAIASEPGEGNIDRELSELQNRIAQMRAVADDLSNNI
ncbi:MAG TPA: hypothetical protein EYG79_07410 [Rhodobacteraceae bacterium]|nr:hypothetical protein [Paracoccaceae bacterium]